MENKVTLRQFTYTFLLLSITPIFSSLPGLLAPSGDSTGYVAVLYYGVIGCVFAWLMYQVLYVYRGYSLLEILSDLVGTVIAKFILLVYALWSVLVILFKIGSYATLLQTTLLPTISADILLGFLFLLCVYAFSKGSKTILRFSEFLFLPAVFFLGILFLFAVPSFHTEYLKTISISSLTDNLRRIPSIASIGGNLMLLLFFLGNIEHKPELPCDINEAPDTKGKQKSHQTFQIRLYRCILQFTLLCFASILLSLCINGPKLTENFTYPIYQSVKGVSILSTFERFDAFITLICIVSDFTAVCVFAFISVTCFSFVFQKKEQEQPKEDSSAPLDVVSPSRKTTLLLCIGAPLVLICCCYVYLRKITQYELDEYFLSYMMPLNLIFQYVLPTLLGIVCFIKRISRGKKGNQEA
ncbi:GerAB/ArcD/ProY family transporter [Lachnoclostridium phytofermentans]|uniref:Spore germination protein n=1 Tax=Lachnoclostridium phytofermentans (strain ATCC 700394 / DSM 18823 / ISDg) TaxID=357809 RepID=A9KKP3_LACP7|nr:GerAB/ArcD/ProY family transporter [Lachnoclostridium phytofermentans]ABX41214.1 Spore germination protein [Lachnoclostridium phytofermentans ISDg]